MKNNISIRRAKIADLPALAVIYAEAYNSLNIGENWENESAQKLLEAFYKYQSDLFFVAIDEDKIIGAIVAILKPWWNGNNIADGELFVDPSYQKKGIGSELIKKLFTVAKEKYNAVSWDTFTHRIYEHPLKWYKEIGFEEPRQWVLISGDIDKVLEKLQ